MNPEAADALIRKYGRPGSEGRWWDRGLRVQHGNVEVNHHGRRVVLPGPAGSEFLKHTEHPHAATIAALTSHPIKWDVSEKALPVVQKYGADLLGRMAWADPGHTVGIDPQEYDGFATSQSGSGVGSAKIVYEPKRNLVHLASLVGSPGRPRGWGAKKFLDAVGAYRDAGFRKVHISSAEGSPSDPSWNGYYTWPRLGFEGQIHPADLLNAPEHLRDAKTFHDLFSRPGGPDWWKAHGNTAIDLHFDLRDGSEHMTRLLAYLHKKRDERGS